MSSTYVENLSTVENTLEEIANNLPDIALHDLAALVAFHVALNEPLDGVVTTKNVATTAFNAADAFMAERAKRKKA